MDSIIKNKNLIICNNNDKTKILEELNNKKELIDIKVMNINEYKKSYYFNYDISAVKYLYDKYKIKIDNIYEILDNLYYVENKKYKSDKLNYLVNIKNELIENNLLITNLYFKDYIKSYNIILYNLEKQDEFTLKMFNNYKEINDKYSPHPVNIYSFENIEQEVEFIFNEIAILLSKNIDINKIYFGNTNSEYYPLLKRFSILYNIPIEDLNNESISKTKIGKTIIEMVKNNKKEEIEEYLLKNKENNITKQIINILNKYSNYNLIDVIELIKYDFKNTNISKPKYKNVIKINEIGNIKDDEYIFLMGFNNGLFPKTYKDTDYISDNIKKEVLLNNSEEKNKIEKQKALNNIYKTKNITISYKKNTPFNTYYVSSLIDDLEKNECTYNSSYNYSENYNKIKYGKLLDKYLKYSYQDPLLPKLYYNYEIANYLDYNNKYKKINKINLKEYIDNKLILSYSSIDNFYKCKFKYYIENILKLNPYEDMFAAKIGTIFHAVLEKYNQKDFDFEKIYNEEINKFEFNNKEQFFIQKLKKELELLINVLNNQSKLTLLKDEMHERKISLILNENPYIEFKGFVDKIMYKEMPNDTIISIIDYKTGMPDIDIKNLEFGLNMQLPVYLYLIKESKIFKNPKFAGIYLQHIISPEIKDEGKTTEQEQKKENLKLVGYSNKNFDILSIFDSTYENSEIIKSMKLNKNGTIYRYAKTLSDEEMEEINKNVNKKIIEAANDILESNFEINPKILEGKNISCEFCKYKDICYKTYEDNVYINCTEESEDEQDA